MKNKTILALPLLAGSLLFNAGILSAADEPAKRPEMSREAAPPPPNREEAREPSSWMPMHYQMPRYYHMMEPEMIYGYKLMSPKERADYMMRLHTARTFEERERLRRDHHRLMQDRAMKRRIMLPDMGPGNEYRPGGGMMPGGGRRY